MAASDPLAHTLYEDALALLMGTLFIALGLALLTASEISIGGTAGIALLVHLGTGIEFGTAFFLANVPFFAFGYLAFGRAYLHRSIIATALLSVETAFLPLLLSFAHVDAFFAALAGGLLCGMGMLALIRHNTGLGGFGIAAVYLQQRLNWRAGYVLLAADSLVVAAAFWFLAPLQVLLSVFAIIFLNIVLALYHKPGRYAGF